MNSLLINFHGISEVRITNSSGYMSSVGLIITLELVVLVVLMELVELVELPVSRLVLELELVFG